jgi:hypothetical protein
MDSPKAQETYKMYHFMSVGIRRKLLARLLKENYVYSTCLRRPMKTYSLFFATLLLLLVLSACGGSATPSTETTISDVYTAVAITLTAQANPVAATETWLPTSSPTPAVSPTQIPLSPTHQSVPTSLNISVCDNSAYISDVTIPDGTILAPGQTFVKTWMFQNTGSCAWSADYSLTFVSGNAMSGSTTTIDQSVASGNQAKISVSLTAPDTAGTYTGYWRLTNKQGIAFGISVYVQIVVSIDAATITPTSTATSTSTVEPSSTPTPTVYPPTSTDTPVPTDTETPIPTDTPTP